MRIYPEGFNQNTNKELNKVSLKGDIGKADVSYINIYRPTTEIELTEAIKDKQIVLVSINSILLEEGKDYKVSEDKKKIVSLIDFLNEFKNTNILFYIFILLWSTTCFFS